MRLLTEGEDINGLLVELAVVLADLIEATIDGVLVKRVLWGVSLRLPTRLKVFESGNGTPESRSKLVREVLLNAVGVGNDGACVIHALPILRPERESRPWNVLDRESWTTDGGDGTE